jgi:predicted AAA+ superfamily ATPase
MPKISESLAGRMVCHTLWPLSQGELHGRKENFISKVFNNKKLSAQNLPPLSQEDIMDIIIKGGYPRSLLSVDSKDRLEWMNSYLDSILQRDIRQLSNIEGLKDLPHLLALLSERAGNLLNVADISRIIGIQQMTLKRYYTLLQMVFLIIEVPAWFTNREKRLAKAPKVYINDTGLGCCLKRIDKEVLFKHRQVLGPLLENFVVMELIKQSSWSDIAPKLYHFRTQAGHEVDIVLEGTNRDIVGIEVKASTSIGENDLKGLKKLQELAQDKFINGIIIYTGSHFLSLGNNLYALPLQYLWGI